MLRPAARIAVVAPSSAWDPARLEKGLTVLRDWGYRPDILPGAPAQWRFCAGDDGTRLSDLHAAFGGSYDGIWMARGGYGLLRLLPALGPLGAWRTPFFGFSDGTVLLNPLAAAGGVAVHAPVVTSLGDITDAPSLEHLRRLLAGEHTEPLPGSTLVAGSAAGRLVGGNLCTLASMCGTRWALRAEGAIVVLEDLGEAAYKVDRMLTQLLLTGAFDGAVGVAVGQLEGATPPPGAAWTMHEVLLDRLAGLRIPVLADLPIGHGPANRAWRYAAARIAGGALHLDGAPVA